MQHYSKHSHFILTTAALTIERNVSREGTGLDIVMPSLIMLGKGPDKTRGIGNVTKSIDLAKINHDESVQPQRENIWVIATRPLQTDHKNYYVGNGDFSLAHMVSDIHACAGSRESEG